jgi:hypothetical protein
MKGLTALVLVCLVFGCVGSYSSDVDVGVNGTASFNKSFGTPTTTIKKITTTTAKKIVTTTVKKVTATTLEATEVTTTTAAEAGVTTTTAAGEAPEGGSGITLTFTPDRETVAMSDKFWEDLMFSNLDSSHDYLVVLRMYSPGGYGDGGTDTNTVFANQDALEMGILKTGFGMPITPFTHKEDGYSSEMEYFTRKGIHHYDITVYDCTRIKAAKGLENCGRGKSQGGYPAWENPEGYMGQETVFHQDKVITVT